MIDGLSVLLGIVIGMWIGWSTKELEKYLRAVDFLKIVKKVRGGKRENKRNATK